MRDELITDSSSQLVPCRRWSGSSRVSSTSRTVGIERVSVLATPLEEGLVDLIRDNRGTFIDPRPRPERRRCAVRDGAPGPQVRTTVDASQALWQQSSGV
jgi:hypothetical protein